MSSEATQLRTLAETKSPIGTRLIAVRPEQVRLIAHMPEILSEITIVEWSPTSEYVKVKWARTGTDDWQHADRVCVVEVLPDVAQDMPPESVGRGLSLYATMTSIAKSVSVIASTERDGSLSIEFANDILPGQFHTEYEACEAIIAAMKRWARDQHDGARAEAGTEVAP